MSMTEKKSKEKKHKWEWYIRKCQQCGSTKITDDVKTVETTDGVYITNVERCLDCGCRITYNEYYVSNDEIDGETDEKTGKV